MEVLNLDFAEKRDRFGAVNVTACYNCGNCTAICPLSKDDGASFPRKMIRASVLGLENKIVNSLDPWLCYYCGDCSETCPRDANPGELMMSLRRYLNARYDWTGLSWRFYTSGITQVGAVIMVALLTLLGFMLFAGPMVSDGETVQLNTFAAAEVIKKIDMGLVLFVVLMLATYVLRMHHFIIGRDPNVKIPLSSYIQGAWMLPVHFISQWRFSKCSNKTFWFYHFLVVTGYLMMFFLIVGFLTWFQTDAIYPWHHPQRLLGYYATIVLLAGSVYFIIGRLRKRTETHKHSHHSDWLFVGLLFLITLTGILIHIFRYLGLALPTYCMYVIHLMAYAPWVLLVIPFSKWTHLAFRPVAVYFHHVKQSAITQAEKA